jgi:hypothetical protein
MKYFILVLFVLLFAGCANPTMVQSIQNGDYGLTCEEIAIEIAEANRLKQEAASKKGFTGGNVARSIFLWPTVLGTYSNANQAINAADIRLSHLAKIQHDMNCKGDK